jgi:hypothetical protein
MMKLRMNIPGIWLYRVLVIIAAALMIISFINPWWTANIDMVAEVTDPVRIYGWGLQHDLIELRSYVEMDETPSIQTAMAWVYLGISVVLVLIGMRLSGKKGQWLLGSVGLIYIIYVAIAIFIVVANRLSELGIPLQGASFFIGSVSDSYGANVHSSLRFWYYLAYIAGGMCVVLAFFRKYIAGKTRPGIQGKI